MKTLEEQVEELNGQKLVEQEQSITVYKGEIIVPVSEVKKALQERDRIAREDILKVIEELDQEDTDKSVESWDRD